MNRFWFGKLFPYCSIEFPPDPKGVFRQFPEVFRCPAVKKGPRVGWSEEKFNRSYLEIDSVDRTPYAYNMLGANNNVEAWRMAGGGGSGGLGLGTGCKENEVVAPAEMIGIACSYRFSTYGALNPISSEAYPGPWHSGRANSVFCDGHVESAKVGKWIARNDTARRRWNKDNQPHPEFW